MIAVDTNLLVRVIVRDDTVQAGHAEQVLRDGAFVSATVLLETAWVLAKAYRIGRGALADALTGVLDMPAVRIADEPAVRWALSRYREAGADIADLIHLTQAIHADRFATFDRGLAAQAGPGTPVPIETLG